MNKFEEKINNISNTSSDSSSDTQSLKLGNYTVNEVVSDSEGVTNEECGITLKQNNKFSFYMGWGATLSGNYEIKDNKLICTATQREWSGGPGDGQDSTDVVLKFDIMNDNKLKLSNVEVNFEDTENTIWDDGMKVGMTYSIKE